MEEQLERRKSTRSGLNELLGLSSSATPPSTHHRPPLPATSTSVRLHPAEEHAQPRSGANASSPTPVDPHLSAMLYVASAQPATAQLSALSCDFLTPGTKSLIIKCVPFPAR